MLFTLLEHFVKYGSLTCILEYEMVVVLEWTSSLASWNLNTLHQLDQYFDFGKVNFNIYLSLDPTHITRLERIKITDVSYVVWHQNYIKLKTVY